MREIKFRAWDKKRQIMSRVTSLHEDGECDVWYEDTEEHDILNINDDFEIMQFTGLYDKNGKEIYEGDIIKVNPWASEEINEIGKVIYKHGSVRLNFKQLNTKNCSHSYYIDNWMYDGKFEQLEVIGNIYENPELLEDKK